MKIDNETSVFENTYTLFDPISNRLGGMMWSSVLAELRRLHNFWSGTRHKLKSINTAQGKRRYQIAIGTKRETMKFSSSAFSVYNNVKKIFLEFSDGKQYKGMIIKSTQLSSEVSFVKITNTHKHNISPLVSISRWSQDILIARSFNKPSLSLSVRNFPRMKLIEHYKPFKRREETLWTLATIAMPVLQTAAAIHKAFACPSS